MKIKTDYAASHAVITLDDNEVLHEHVLRTALQHIASDVANLWNVDIHLTPDVVNANQDMLRSLAFGHAGTLNGASGTLICYRKAIRRSGDGNLRNDSNQSVSDGLTVHPTYQSSVEERIAMIALHEKYNWPIPEDLQQLKHDRDVAATAGFHQVRTTIEQRAAKIKSDATLKADTTEATVVPDFLFRQNAAAQSDIQKEIDRLQQKPESA